MSSVRSCEDLMNPSRSINKVLNAQSKEEVLNNRLRLKTTIEIIRWLALQGCAFGGHDESLHSENAGNFKELLKLLNPGVAEVLENAPRNAMYTSPDIQKQVLNLLAEAVRKNIRKEVGNNKFCILVDLAQDISNREQMAIILRFIVDDNGFVRERFFGVVGVEDTNALTLKEISDVLARYSLQIENMRGQGYEGACNMRGAWNNLQALFLKECPYAYYVHCFAHRLQITLVASFKDVHDVWLFFSQLSSIVNLVGASPKRKSQLQSAQEEEIQYALAIGEIETGRGANQICTLQRAGATRWGSHFAYVSSLIDMFDATCIVLEGIIRTGSSNSMRGEAKGGYDHMKAFEFVFILHLLHKAMGIADVLCQALQQKCQDILNAMSLDSSTKTVLKRLRDEEYDAFLESVILLCGRHGIDILNMDAPCKMGTGRLCQQKDCITLGHRYHFDMFNEVINYQLEELNIFTEDAMELLTLSAALDPRDGFKSFNIDSICNLAEKFYPSDFTKQDINILRSQLLHYEINVPHNSHF